MLTGVVALRHIRLKHVQTSINSKTDGTWNCGPRQKQYPTHQSFCWWHLQIPRAGPTTVCCCPTHRYPSRLRLRVLWTAPATVVCFPHQPTFLLLTSTDITVRADNSMEVPNPPATLLVTSTDIMVRADNIMAVANPPATLLMTPTDIMGHAYSITVVPFTDTSAYDVFEYHGQRRQQNCGVPPNGNTADDSFRYRDSRQQQYNDGRSFGHPSSDGSVPERQLCDESLYAGITTKDSFKFRDPHLHHYDGASPTGNHVGNNVWNPVSRRQQSSGVFWRRNTRRQPYDDYTTTAVSGNILTMPVFLQCLLDRAFTRILTTSRTGHFFLHK